MTRLKNLSHLLFGRHTEQTVRASLTSEIVHPKRVRADFSGLFSEVLCLSHQDTCIDEDGEHVLLQEGMKLTAFDEDLDEHGNRDQNGCAAEARAGCCVSMRMA